MRDAVARLWRRVFCAMLQRKALLRVARLQETIAAAIVCRQCLRLPPATVAAIAYVDAMRRCRATVALPPLFCRR